MKKLQKCALGLVVLSLLGMISCNEQKDGVSVNDTASNAHAMANGAVVTDAKYNGVVSIYSTNQKQSICTGTLIHPQYVLTSASCVENIHEDTVIAFGNNPRDLSRNYTMYPGVGNMVNHYDIAELIPHANYAANDYGIKTNDIALIKLVEPVDSRLASPIPILNPNHALSRDKLFEIGDQDIYGDVATWQSDGDSTNKLFNYIGFGVDEEGTSDYKLINEHMVDIGKTYYCGAADGDSIMGCLYPFGKVHINGCHPNKELCNNEANAEYCESGFLCVDKDDLVMLPFGSFYFQGSWRGLTCDADNGGPALIYDSDYGQEVVAGVESYHDLVCSTYAVYTAVQDFYDSFIMNVAPEIAEYWNRDATHFDTNCGNGEIDYDELCDGSALLVPKTCEDLVGPGFYGEVHCSADCHSYDVSDCRAPAIPDEGSACDVNTFADSCDGSNIVYCDGERVVVEDCSKDREDGHCEVFQLGDGLRTASCVSKYDETCSDIGSTRTRCLDSIDEDGSITYYELRDTCFQSDNGSSYYFSTEAYLCDNNGCNADQTECVAYVDNNCTSRADCEDGEICNAETGQCESVNVGCFMDNGAHLNHNEATCEDDTSVICNNGQLMRTICGTTGELCIHGACVIPCSSSNACADDEICNPETGICEAIYKDCPIVGGNEGDCCDRFNYQVSCINNGANALICSHGQVKKWDCAYNICSVSNNRVECTKPE